MPPPIQPRPPRPPRPTSPTRPTRPTSPPKHTTPATPPPSGPVHPSSFISPLDCLLPYQRLWINDPSRFKIGLMARQTGKSWISALEAVRDCLERKTTWVCLSAGERQALEWMLKAREHAEAFKVATAGYTEDRDSAETLLKAAEIRWPNGSRLVAIPANPDTARGYSANLILDEFAFHENPDAIWRAIYPSISNPLKGQFNIRVVSTPNGLGNKFADLWGKAEIRRAESRNPKTSTNHLAPAAPEIVNRKSEIVNLWSAHRVTIHDAIASGLPVNLDELRAGLDDPEGWAQEYECQFLDAAAVLLPYDLIATCESAEATASTAFDFYQTRTTQHAPGSPRGDIYLGLDFARKRDLSVCWCFERIGDVLHTREVLELTGLPTPDQVAALRPRIMAARRIALDYTGSGVGLGDYLAKEFGEYNPDQHQFGKVDLVTFTAANKPALFSKLRMAFDSRQLRIPVHRAIREDLHSMQRVTTTQGNVTYRAPHTSDGHADRCTALALALRAAGSGTAGALTTMSGIFTGGNPTTQFVPRHWGM